MQILKIKSDGNEVRRSDERIFYKCRISNFICHHSTQHYTVVI
jgi:hypothetical protein